MGLRFLFSTGLRMGETETDWTWLCVSMLHVRAPARLYLCMRACMCVLVWEVVRHAQLHCLASMTGKYNVPKTMLLTLLICYTYW